MAAKKKSTTPNYDANVLNNGKKVHDLVGKLQDIGDDDHIRGLSGELTHIVENYRYNNKGSDHRVNWTEKGDDEHKKFAHSLWETAADHIAKSYLKYDDKKIAAMKKEKDIDGNSVWDQFMATYLGGMDKDTFWNEVKDENELSIENMLQVYVNKISGRHLNFRHRKMLSTNIKEAEDMDAVHGYVKMAKGHHKEAMRKLKVPKRFTTIDEAASALSTAYQYLPKNYHPDKADTYTK